VAAVATAGRCNPYFMHERGAGSERPFHVFVMPNAGGQSPFRKGDYPLLGAVHPRCGEYSFTVNPEEH